MPDLVPVFSALRGIMRPYADRLVATRDDDRELYVDTRHVPRTGKPLFFGAVSLKKSFVSFHLMPVYMAPELLDAASPALKARMQGKSCFNFRAIEPTLLDELAAVTRAGYGHYRREGYVE